MNAWPLSSDGFFAGGVQQGCALALRRLAWRQEGSHESSAQGELNAHLRQPSTCMLSLIWDACQSGNGQLQCSEVSSYSFAYLTKLHRIPYCLLCCELGGSVYFRDDCAGRGTSSSCKRDILLQDNVALIVVLDATAGQGQERAADVPRRQLICVANTHIHANPELNDVKLWQVQDHHPYGPFLHAPDVHISWHASCKLSAYVTHCRTKKDLAWRKKRIGTTISCDAGHIQPSRELDSNSYDCRPSLEPHSSSHMVKTS